MTTTVYNDLLGFGANMLVLDAEAKGVEFQGLEGSLFFEQYDNVNNIGASALQISNHKTIKYLGVKWEINDEESLILSGLSWFNKDLESLIVVSEMNIALTASGILSDTTDIYEGNDTIIGNKFNDRLRGGNGNDTLLGNAGDDLLMGDTGMDSLEGGAGKDTLIGGLGKDLLRGNSGADIFKFESIAESSAQANSADMIVDFNAKQKDRIDLSSIDAIASSVANDKFTFIARNDFTGVAGQLNYKVEFLLSPSFEFTQQMVVYGDVNGDKVADFAIIVLPTDIWGSTTLMASSFIL